MLNVKTEVGKLRKVMLHRPGGELLNLSPLNLEPLLFDDIPFLEVAQAEHDAFARMLADEGVEVVYVEDLVTEVLEAKPILRDQYIRDYVRESGLAGCRVTNAVIDYLRGIEHAHALVKKTIEGVRRDELDLAGAASLDLADLVGTAQSGNPDLVIDPLPNLYFTRDTFTVVGHGVNINSMFSENRRRETLLSQYIFSYHPTYSQTPVWYRRTTPYHLEGGDFLNLTGHKVAIGISQRTQSAAIDSFAKGIFWDGDASCPIEEILALLIPDTRAMMHLDTVLTQIDVDAFLVHPGILDSLEAYRVTRGVCAGDLHVELLDEPLNKVLGRTLGIGSVKLIRCGGDDPIAAAREQWNDGSNTLAASPGRVFVYQRNSVTNSILYKEGYDLLEIPSAELSRGRGGPHCMSMPFVRDDL